jgi:uncharacterized protein
MVLESHQPNEGTVFNFFPFKFIGYEEKPSAFSSDFVYENIEYEYSFRSGGTHVKESPAIPGRFA